MSRKETRECSVCHVTKPPEQFGKRGRQCRECMRARARDYSRRTNNANARAYVKTKSGFLMRLYHNMKCRITGAQKQKHHLYAGKELLDRQDFYKLANACPTFHRLFAEWEESNRDRKLTPSVDRIDPSKGYVISNMEWVTHSVNSARGGAWKRSVP